jgi:hypothetical protein
MSECVYCGSTRDVTRFLSVNRDECRCSECHIQPENWHRNPPHQEEIEETC